MCIFPGLVDDPIKDTDLPEDGKGASLSSPLIHIEGFLEALTCVDKDGRIVVNKQSTSHSIII